MSGPIAFRHYNHINQTVHDLDAAIRHVTHVLGGQFLWVTPPNPFTRACLVNFGGAVIELVEKRKQIATEPEDGDYCFWHSPGTTGFIMDWDRIGPAFVGCEFLVDDLPGATAIAREQGLRLFDQGQYQYFLTYADQCHGISFEVTDVNWYTRPSPDFYAEEMKDAAYWSDDHPLGITGYRFSVAVKSHDGVTDFFGKLCGSTEVYREERPRLAAKALGVQMADVVVDFLAPTEPGPISAFIDRYGERIRALILTVKDVDTVRRYYEARQVPLVAGDVPGSIAIVPDQNLGVLYQFEPAR